MKPPAACLSPLRHTSFAPQPPSLPKMPGQRRRAKLAGAAAVGVLLALAGCNSVIAPSQVSPEYPAVVGGAMDRPARFMVGGAVTGVDPVTQSLTIQTPMNLHEKIRFDERTEISREGAQQSWAVVRPGTAVKIDYELQEDGGVLARTIAVGQSVQLCPCGPDCRCPPSRGCRVIRSTDLPLTTMR